MSLPLGDPAHTTLAHGRRESLVCAQAQQRKPVFVLGELLDRGLDGGDCQQNSLRTGPSAVFVFLAEWKEGGEKKTSAEPA